MLKSNEIKEQKTFQSCNFWSLLRLCFSWTSISIFDDRKFEGLVTPEDRQDLFFWAKGSGKDGSLKSVEGEETSSLLKTPKLGIAESKVIPDDGVITDETCSILVEWLDDEDDGSSEVISQVGPKRTVLHERGLSKIAECLLEPGGFCIKEILWTWPYAFR